MIEYLEDDGTSKFCNWCHKIKPKEEFHKDKGTYDNLSTRCKQCQKAYYEKNKIRIIEKSLIYNKKNYSVIRERELLKKYGITRDIYDKMVLDQNGECKICKSTLDMSKFTHVDHDHKTNKVRGILCHSCNTKLGWLEKYKDQVLKYLDDDL